MIFKNNGYEVVNFGIKVPPEESIKAYQEHHPDAIALSGLLVKSAQQMVTTASDLKDAGIEIPLLVGGAALTGAKEPLHTFRFARQRKGDFLCLSDYVLPAQNGRRDHLALFVVSAGEGAASAPNKQKTLAIIS